MELKKLLTGIENFKTKGDLEIDIKKVACNSKKVVPNSLFVAVRGYDFDGHQYISEAIEKGATAVMLDMAADFKNIKIPNLFMKWLNYIPVCILSALIIDSFIYSETALRLHWQNVLAFIPTLIIAIWTKSLSFTVIIGVLTMALLRFMF